MKENLADNEINDANEEFERNDQNRQKELFSEVWSSEEIESSFISHEHFRINPDLHAKINNVLQKFVGSHYYHNYTSGK